MKYGRRSIAPQAKRSSFLNLVRLAAQESKSTLLESILTLVYESSFYDKNETVGFFHFVKPA